jgi:hypothetical protein
MAGTLTISTLSDGTNSTSSTNCIKGSAKAWANFNGNTATIRDSYNVSSVTVNGTGDFTVNFTNAFADGNYCCNVTSKQDEAGGGTYTFGSFYAGSGATVANVFQAGSVRVTNNIGNSTTLYPAVVMCVSVFK